jgi:hypothetical protein
MIVAVITLTILLVTIVLAARKTRPAAHGAENVVSLDAYRAVRRGGGRSVPSEVVPSFQFPLSASGGGIPVSSPGGGLRTCRQPDGRLGRPTARTEPA